MIIADNSKGNLIEKLACEYALRYAESALLRLARQTIQLLISSIIPPPGPVIACLLFLNDDTSVVEPGWLEAMVEFAVRPEVGAVGAKLLYPAGGIQHGGVVMGILTTAAMPLKGWTALFPISLISPMLSATSAPSPAHV